MREHTLIPETQPTETQSTAPYAPAAPVTPAAAPAAKSAAPDGRRGRPRPQDTILRDNLVKKTLESGPKTRDEVASELGIKPSHAYLSLIRLRQNNVASRMPSDEGIKWQLTS